MNFDLLIVGAGLAGSSLALALRSSKLKVALVESRAPVFPKGIDQRVYAISPASQQFLSRIGAWERLEPSRMCAVREMDICGDASGHLWFSAHDAGLPELAWIIESSLMHAEFWETVKRQHNVTVLCPAECETLKVENDGVLLGLANDTFVRARLLVGADGVNSWVRAQAGITAHISPYDQKGVVANFAVAEPHRQVARQWFREDGVVALLPLGGQNVSLVWSCENDRADQLMAMDKLDFCDKVFKVTGGVVGELQLISDRAAFPLRLLRVDSVVKSRIALIGDAGHAIHPLSGHGINLGFGDASVLANELAALGSWEDPGNMSLLRRYARARAEESLLMQYSTHGLSKLFGAKNGVVSQLRNIGMNLTNRLPVVKDALARYSTLGHF